MQVQNQNQLNVESQNLSRELGGGGGGSKPNRKEMSSAIFKWGYCTRSSQINRQYS